MRKKTNCYYCGAELTEKFFEDRIRLFCEKCNEPIYENPIPATCLVTIDDSKRVLLVKRNVEPKSGFWCLPGGFIELGENPEEGALRELEEETGLKGKIEMLLGVSSNRNQQYNTVLIVGYLVESYSGFLNAGYDASDVAWFHYKEIPEIAFESHKNFIRMYYATYGY
jgi:ADP-ribose pyrophosphatase YjhB (NUDIX family)